MPETAHQEDVARKEALFAVHATVTALPSSVTTGRPVTITWSIRPRAGTRTELVEPQFYALSVGGDPHPIASLESGPVGIRVLASAGVDVERTVPVALIARTEIRTADPHADPSAPGTPVERTVATSRFVVTRPAGSHRMQFTADDVAAAVSAVLPRLGAGWSLHGRVLPPRGVADPQDPGPGRFQATVRATLFPVGADLGFVEIRDGYAEATLDLVVRGEGGAVRCAAGEVRTSVHLPDVDTVLPDVIDDLLFSSWEEVRARVEAFFHEKMFVGGGVGRGLVAEIAARVDDRIQERRTETLRAAGVPVAALPR